jgi:hypothetical protein
MVSLSLQITNEVFFAQSNSFFAIILPNANSGDSLKSLLQLPTLELNSNSSCARSHYIASRRTHRKHRFLYCCVLIHCCRNVFTAPLRSNERELDHRKHRSFIVAPVRFLGNVFTERLPSNELFRLSGVMSQYVISHSAAFRPEWLW